MIKPVLHAGDHSFNLFLRGITIIFHGNNFMYLVYLSGDNWINISKLEKGWRQDLKGPCSYSLLYIIKDPQLVKN